MGIKFIRRPDNYNSEGFSNSQYIKPEIISTTPELPSKLNPFKLSEPYSRYCLRILIKQLDMLMFRF